MRRLPRRLPPGLPADWDAREAILVAEAERADIFDERTRRARRRIFAAAFLLLAAAALAAAASG